jgi:hypothetical protein
MFHVTLSDEYQNVRRMGLNENEILRLARMSFEHALDAKAAAPWRSK